MVEDWSMVLHIGTGNASACRIILEAVCEMNIDMQALKGMAGIIKALFRTNAHVIQQTLRRNNSTVRSQGHAE